MSNPIDLLTRQWWRATGRPVDLAGEHAWLNSPINQGSQVGNAWVEEAARLLGGEGSTVRRGDGRAGLMAAMSDLDGPGFRAADLQPAVRQFYEHTAGWRMEVWSSWNPVFWPGGELISRWFGKRVGQLALPMRPLDVARGMDSTVDLLVDAHGVQRGAAWLRTLRATGDYVYSGCYRVGHLPGSDRPSVQVSFPLEQGNVQVFLRPEVDADGSLWLHSPEPTQKRQFGGHGAYVLVHAGGGTHAASVPLHETFHVFTDDEGVLRTDHALRLGRAPVVKLHYKVEPRD